MSKTGSSLSTAAQLDPYKFKKGISGNPSGMPKEYKEIVRLARSYAPEAVATLADLLRNSANENIKIRAAEVLLERGFGRPTETINLNLNDGEDKLKQNLQEAQPEVLMQALTLLNTVAVANESANSNN